MNTKQRDGFIATLFSTILLGHLSTAVADTSSPLDVDQHPQSPQYESLFPDQVVPLDTELSWTQRFLGDESFNQNESLPSTSPVIDQSSFHTNDDASQMNGKHSSGFDASGVVKQVKLSEGKVKIEHGPIDRLGMPGMAMMFRVEDPDQLTNLDKGAEVAFNVENTSAGFSITHIELSSRKFDTTGVVKQVKSSDGKVKIEHGPIERLGMPGMTMMFRVEDPGQLIGLAKGSEVAFNVDNTAAGFSITNIEIMGEKTGNQFDANGTVKSVRLSQGKVKIEHGPIERLGMPGMTMLFKVKNPAELDALEKDMPVEFNVENGSSGFEITLIKPMLKSHSSSMSVKTSQRVCYSVGPFNNQSIAAQVKRRYQSRGATISLSSNTAREYIGDIVFIDGLGTRDAALSLANKLKAEGITDTMVLNEPGKRNALSLGVFGLKRNSEHLQARVESMDIAVKSEARYREKTTYWLHSEQGQETQPLKLLTAEELESGARQTTINCKAGEDA